ncbi:hypothetical protein LEN26_016969 [Aphanomyces euteiches]|nr:hypothetical protein LEN26_016969 [Aphanomyces euteiches]
MRFIFEFQTGYPQLLRPFAQYIRCYDDYAELFLTQDTSLFVESMLALDKILRPYLAIEPLLSPQRVDALLHCFPSLAHNVFSYAIWAGHLDLLGLMVPRVGYICHNTTDIAAFLGQMDVLVYLEAQNLAKFSSKSLHWACYQGHLKVVEFLSPRVPVSETIAMDAAAMNGHFEIVKFLHANRSEGCTTKAMDQAAARGHLEIVKFLHCKRSEGCTSAAIDKAAANGHLDVVKFLHAHRTECATTSAMNLASCHGHLDVVKFLMENRPEGCTIRAFLGATEANHWQVAAFILQHANQLKLDLQQVRSSFPSYIGELDLLTYYGNVIEPSTSESATALLTCAGAQRLLLFYLAWSR